MPKEISMSKATDRRTDRLKRMQAEAAARERKRRLAIAGAAAAVVVIVVVVLIVVKVAGGGSNNTAQTPVSQQGLTTVVRDVTTVPAATFDEIGVGSAVGPKAISGADAITSGGKPQMLYVGGEFCPYCAAARWSMVAALSRFGTFTGLGEMTSSSTDVYPNTNTLTFLKSTFTSKYLVFTPYETEDRDHNKLQTPPAADEATFEKYDAPPYVASSQQGGIPFIDIAGKWFAYGSPYNPQDLAGLSHLQIASALRDPTSTVSKDVIGAANYFTAAICSTTDQQPSTVCSSTGVKAAAAKLGG
jgi:hypothetical protein